MERSSFLVSNVHCPSCVSAISDILKTFHSTISKINVSILTGEVAFVHAPNLHLEPLYQEVQRAGYDIVAAQSQQHLLEWPHFLTSFKDKTLHGKEIRDKKAKHKDLCKACQAAPAQNEKPVASKSTLPKAGSSKVQWTKSTFALSGLTCSSCVASVKEALNALESVQADIILLPASASVLHDSSVTKVQHIKQAIEDAGYEADLIISKDVNSDLLIQSEDPANSRYKVTFSVNGMTCAACVSGVSDGIKAVSGVESFSVDLMSASATAILVRKADADTIVQEIEDRGFEAAIVDIANLSAAPTTAKEQEKTRTVFVRIDGMFCQTCIEKVNSCLSSLPQVMSHTPILSIDKPITKILYTPSPPEFTLRTIKNAVSDIGGFQLTIHHDATLAERANKAQLAERLRIFYRLLITFIFAVPVFVVGVVGMMLLSKDNAFNMQLMTKIWGNSNVGTWIMFALATPIQFGIGMFFYARAYKSLRSVWRRNPRATWKQLYHSRLLKWGSMDSLVALGTTIGYCASVIFLALDVVEISAQNSTYFDVSVFLMLFILCGRFLENVSKAKTGDALRELARTKPSTGLLYMQSEESDKSVLEEVEADFIEIGDLILVPVGSAPPVDAILVEGSSSSTFDESSMTGETRPVLKQSNDQILAGTINAGPSACVARVNREPGATALDNIMASVKDAMSKKADIERIAELITSYFVPAIVGIAILTFLIWLVRGLSGSLPDRYLDLSNSSGAWVLFAVQFSVAVLVVACPCGIGLAAPTASLVGLGLAAQNGIMPTGNAFQEFSNIDHLVLDKTGTITEGSFTVSETLLNSHLPPAIIYEALMLVEESSTHPIAKGITQWAKRELGHIIGASSCHLLNVEEDAGRGVVAQIAVGEDQIEVAVGNRRLMDRMKASTSSAEDERSAAWQVQGLTGISVSAKLLSSANTSKLALSSDHQVVALLCIQDPPRIEAARVIDYFQQIGIKVWMLTGDSQATASEVGKQVGIAEENVIAEVLPEDKKSFVESLQRGDRGTKRSKKGLFRRSTRPLVAFCGDGINDAAALALADVGIAMGDGSSVALSSADFSLLKSSLLNLVTLHDIARLTLRKIYTNFFWALLYNIILIPLAAGAFYDLGQTRLPPVWAALAMALSSISVVLNSLFLRWTYSVPKMVKTFRQQQLAPTSS